MRIPPPTDREPLQDYLRRLDLLDHGFAYGELVKPWSYRFREPPRDYWRNLAKVLRQANLFRELAIASAGVAGLRVAAAYRPIGGAKNSAHKYARALDLDRIGGDGREYYKAAVRFWCEQGAKLDMGLGLYTATEQAKGGVRVHLDIGHGTRSWQGLGKSFVRPYTINGRAYGLAAYLAVKMDLKPPTFGA